ncbi:hypothetical protein M011DRAFT_478505 [Sporormia fimetaria CBS 119925]|uniref:Uncharacterized protein n=1 Tax=Sporormia fimetaria CBS 119925 TaxID=1340428 RepID=A0A6A6V632_9PLEO|nr:hypothetical protein M011DRAFT_478505 [Sporormia fimetaria CBS 119925]
MYTIRRSCQSALAANWAYPVLSSSSRRAFSQSAACRRGALPLFLEPSSPELQELLSKLNSKILLPANLTREQKQLIFKKENKARLEAEPIEITLGDVTLPLEHIDRMKDVPNRWSVLKGVLDNSKTAEDWENVLRAVEGMHAANIRIKPQQYEMIVRRLFHADMPHLVLKAVQRPEKTGLTLAMPGVVNQVMWGLHKHAAKSNWEDKETEKMLRFAEQIVELMENPAHHPKKQSMAKLAQIEPNASPLVLAVPLELAAGRAKRHLGGQDTDGKVKKYATRFLDARRRYGYGADQGYAKLLIRTLALWQDKPFKGHLRKDLPRIIGLPTTEQGNLRKHLPKDTGLPNNEADKANEAIEANEANESNDASEASEPKDTETGKMLADRESITNTLTCMVPVWHAAKMANQVLGADMPSADVARDVEVKLEDTLKWSIAVLQRKAEGPLKYLPVMLERNMEECASE